MNLKASNYNSAGFDVRFSQHEAKKLAALKDIFFSPQNEATQKSTNEAHESEMIICAT
jgi:hypothetical protein